MKTTPFTARTAGHIELLSPEEVGEGKLLGYSITANADATVQFVAGAAGLTLLTPEIRLLGGKTVTLPADTLGKKEIAQAPTGEAVYLYLKNAATVAGEIVTE